MRLPTYYCPHCKRFKRDNFIDRIDEEYAIYCRGCHTELISTETELLNMLENFLNNLKSDIEKDEEK